MAEYKDEKVALYLDTTLDKYLPVQGKNGALFIQSSTTHTALVTANALRVTASQTSPVILIDSMTEKRLMIDSSLNQSCNVTVEWSLDNTTYVQVGTAKTINATSGMSIITETDTALTGLNIGKGYLRFKYICSVAPTTGTISIYLQLSSII